MERNQVRFSKIDRVNIEVATDNYPIFQCSLLAIFCKAWHLPMGLMDRLHRADIPCVVCGKACEEITTMITSKCLAHGRLENQ